jgi:TrkA domain protein
VTVYESDLPGVGKKHEVELDDGSRLVVVTHNTGKREVYRRPDADADSERLFELSDQLARQVGTILEGAYFQPVQSTDLETVLEGDTVLEWVTVAADSEYAGQTLAESDVRGKTGVSVIAIQRDDRTIANPGADTVLEAGDTIVALGPRDACRSFRREIGGEIGVD